MTTQITITLTDAAVDQNLKREVGATREQALQILVDFANDCNDPVELMAVMEAANCFDY